MNIVKVMKIYKDRKCVMCGSDLYNKYGRLITISVEFYACGDCTYLRKEYLRYLGDHLPAEITDLRNIGVALRSVEYMR